MRSKVRHYNLLYPYKGDSATYDEGVDSQVPDVEDLPPALNDMEEEEEEEEREDAASDEGQPDDLRPRRSHRNRRAPQRLDL